MNDLLEQITGIRNVLSFLIHLNPKERKGGGIWKANLYAFLKRAQTGAQQHPEIVNPSFDMPGWEHSIDLYDRLTVVLAGVGQLFEGLTDTHMALRIEVQRNAGIFLKAAAVAEKGNLPGTTELVKELRDCLPKKKKRKKKMEDGEVPQQNGPDQP